MSFLIPAFTIVSEAEMRNWIERETKNKKRENVFSCIHDQAEL